MFIVIILYEFLICFKYWPLILCTVCKYFLPFSRLYFSLLIVFFFSLYRSLFCFFHLYFCLCHIQKIIVKINVCSFPHLLFCRSFMVSDLTFQSLVHYELILGNGIKYRSNFIFLHVFLWVSQHRLRKRLCFPHGVSLALPLGLSWCGGFIMRCLFCSIGLYIDFYARARLFYLCFVV